MPRDTSHLVRGAAIIASCGVLAPAGGCVSPLIVRPELVAIGMFQLQHAELSRDVRYDHLRGIGLAVGDGRVSLGAIDRRRVIVSPTPEGVYVVTPSAAFVTGRLAEEHGPEWLLAEYTGDEAAEFADRGAAARGVLVIQPGESP